MSNYVILALLVPRENFGARIRRLKSLELDKESFPDKHIYGWDFQWAIGDDDRAKETFNIIENSFEKFPSLSIYINEQTTVTFGSYGYQFAEVNIFHESQGVFGDYKDTIYVEVELPLAGVGQTNNVALRLFLMKLVQVIEPFYGWNSSQDALYYWQQRDKKIAKPWFELADTQIFGSQLYKQLDLGRKLAQLGTQYTDLYHVRKLTESLLWINSPRGLGSEWPASFEVNVYNGKAYDYYLSYVDTALDELVEDADRRHSKALIALRDLIMAN